MMLVYLGLSCSSRVVGPAGVEPATYGFLLFLTAPELLHSHGRESANPYSCGLLSGARRHPWLDYDPTIG